ncbi:MAG: hypothetical protein V1804_00395 [Patescibacteria group bacterium]
MVGTAIGIVRPAAEAILKTRGTTWGPGWVEGKIEAPGLEQPILFLFGKKEEWSKKWGKTCDFSQIADKKFYLAKQEGISTGHIVNNCSWLLKEGEYLYPGAISYHGITIAISGAFGLTDEGISYILIDTLIMLTKLEAKRRIDAGEVQI